jgi:hypothetical protein
LCVVLSLSAAAYRTIGRELPPETWSTITVLGSWFCRAMHSVCSAWMASVASQDTVSCPCAAGQVLAATDAALLLVTIPLYFSARADCRARVALIAIDVGPCADSQEIHATLG